MHLFKIFFLCDILFVQHSISLKGMVEVEVVSKLPPSSRISNNKTGNVSERQDLTGENKELYSGMYLLDKEYVIDYFYSSHWGEDYDQCDGHRQSPININPTRIQVFNDQVWNDLDEMPETMSAVNNGNAVQITGEWKNPPNLEGPGILPYRGKYAFSDVTFHWSKFGQGSEHALEGIRYAMEAQLVFYKELNNKNIMDAINDDDHIAIISVLYQIGKEDNPELGSFIEGLEEIISPLSTTHITSFLLTALLPLETSYYIYPGSITIPPCAETATWMVMTNPCNISLNQLNQLRKITGNNGEPIISNARRLSRTRY